MTTHAAAESGVDLEGASLRSANQPQVQEQTARDAIVCEIKPRREGRVLALAAVSALLGGGVPFAPRPTRRDIAEAKRDRPNHSGYGAEARLAAAQAKRARRAAKRLRTTEGAAPGDDFDGSRSTPHAAQPVPA